MEELWKPIKGYEGFYEISNLGNVKSLQRLVERKDGSNFIAGNRILKPISIGNYLGVQLCKDRSTKKHYLHRLVALNFIKNESPERKTVNHIDGNRFNNALDNLEWMTTKENNRHAINTGLVKMHGEDNPVCKFTDQAVKEIRELYDSGVYRQFELSAIYEMSRMQVSRIVRRKLRNTKGVQIHENV